MTCVITEPAAKKSVEDIVVAYARGHVCGKKLFRCANVWDNVWRVTFYNKETCSDLWGMLVLYKDGEFTILDQDKFI